MSDFLESVFYEARDYVRQNLYRIGEPIFNLTEDALRSLGLQMKDIDMEVKLFAEYEEKDIKRIFDVIGKCIKTHIQAIEIYDYVKNYYQLRVNLKFHTSHQNSHLFLLKNGGGFEYITVFKINLILILDEKNLKYL